MVEFLPITKIKIEESDVRIKSVKYEEMLDENGNLLIPFNLKALKELPFSMN